MSPGSLVTIFGDNLSGCISVADTPVRSICQTEVLINSNPVLLYYISSTQIVVHLPANLSPNQAFEVVVRRTEENSSDPVMVPAAAVRWVAPAMYFYRTTDASNRAWMLQP